MRRQNYYLASRVPSRGGLKIIRTDRDFPNEYADFIEKNCLEIVVPEYSHNALLIYPLGNGEHVVSLARKVKGSEWETRIHENIHGYVIEGEEFSERYVDAIAEKTFDDCFYSGKIEKAVTLSDEDFYYHPVNHKAGNLERFWLAMTRKEKVGFFYAVYGVIAEGKKTQLAVPAPMRRIVQAACYDILPYYCRNKLFTISGGECTQSDADILFVDELKYQDTGKYRKMNLRTFIEEGLMRRSKGFNRMVQLINKKPSRRKEIYAYINNILRDIEVNGDKKTDELLMSIGFYDLLLELMGALDNKEYQKVHQEELICKFEHVTAGSRKIQELLCKEFEYLIVREEKESLGEVSEERDQIALCMEYVMQPYLSKTIMSTVRNDLYRKAKQEDWEIFQKELRLRMGEIPLLPRQREKYVSVLFLAYEYYRGSCTEWERTVLSAPYDLEGILFFLLQKTRSSWEYKKYVAEVLRQYTEVFLLYLPKREVEKNVRKIKGHRVDCPVCGNVIKGKEITIN